MDLFRLAATDPNQATGLAFSRPATEVNGYINLVFSSLINLIENFRGW